MKHEQLSEQQIPDDLKKLQNQANGGFLFTKKEVVPLIERIAKAESKVAELEAKLRRISDWCGAYPLEVFPAPDLKSDRKLLGDSEFTRLNAHSMRHVVEGIALIAKEPA